MKHTPGPWKVIDGWDKNEKGTYFPSVLLGKTHKAIVINESHDQQIASIMANAYLIAAAPELLDACRSALETLEGDDSGSISVDRLRNAIAKAEGEGE